MKFKYFVSSERYIYLKNSLVSIDENDENIARDRNAPPSYEETVNTVKIEDIKEQRVIFHQYLEEPPPYSEF